MKGYVNSIETLGALDGPGLRTVIFLQGCHLRCKFCHNIDSVTEGPGNVYTPEALVAKVLKDKPYWEVYEDNDRLIEEAKVADSEMVGGVTISGGDPMFQKEFLLELVKLLKENEVHVAVESSLFVEPQELEQFIPYVDLWMVSIKEIDPEKHKDLTGRSNEKILRSLKHLDNNLPKDKKIRLRFVVIPGITTYPELVDQVGELAASLEHLEKLELLPYVTMGKDKWIKLFKVYHLEGVPDAKEDDIAKVSKILEKYEIEVAY